MSESLTAERLRSLLSYDYKTGVFRWKVQKGRQKAGDLAHTICEHGRVQIRIDKVNYWSSRLAWLHVYGRWPNRAIDHINGDPSDNRIRNLRDVSLSANQHNRRINKNNTSGYLGVKWDGSRSKWAVSIMAYKKNHFIGRFPTKELASEAYRKAKMALHYPVLPLTTAQT